MTDYLMSLNPAAVFLGSASLLLWTWWTNFVAYRSGSGDYVPAVFGWAWLTLVGSSAIVCLWSLICLILQNL